MKRYWKLISILLFTVTVIGMFYFQASTAASNSPEFSIKMVSGSDEGKKLSVFGEYNDRGSFQDSVQINESETIYRKEISFIDSLNGVFFQSPEIRQLQREHRNFMRGKEVNPSLFYEDEAYLAYANITSDFDEMGPSDFKFEIEVLDKGSKKVTVINESIPNQNTYNYAFVQDVQKIDGKLKVVVRIESTINQDVESIEEIHLFTFDLNSRALFGDDILASSDKSQKDENISRTHFIVLNDSENIDSEKYLLSKIEKVEDVPYRDGFSTKEIDSKFTLYNYETNEQKELFNEKQQLDFETVSIYGSTIYLMKKTVNGLEILPYQIESGKFSPKQTIQIKISEERDSPIIKLKNNKIYIVSPYKDLKTDAVILIADLKTWKTVYEGRIEQSNSSEIKEDYSLSISSLNVE
jgi:hypothetical protein